MLVNERQRRLGQNPALHDHPTREKGKGAKHGQKPGRYSVRLLPLLPLTLHARALSEAHREFCVWTVWVTVVKSQGNELDCLGSSSVVGRYRSTLQGIQPGGGPLSATSLCWAGTPTFAFPASRWGGAAHTDSSPGRRGRVGVGHGRLRLGLRAFLCEEQTGAKGGDLDRGFVSPTL